MGDIRETKCVFSIFLPFWVQPTRLVSPVGPSTEKTAAGRSRKTTWTLKAQRAIVPARAPPLACPILMSLITSTGETARFGSELNEVGTNSSTFLMAPQSLMAVGTTDSPTTLTTPKIALSLVTRGVTFMALNLGPGTTMLNATRKDKLYAKSHALVAKKMHAPRDGLSKPGTKMEKRLALKDLRRKRHGWALSVHAKKLVVISLVQILERGTTFTAICFVVWEFQPGSL